MICEWCEQPFQPRRGGSPQRFCGPKCRSAFWSGLRQWGERAVVAGIVTIGDIRNGAAAACTLLPRGISTAPADTRRPPSPPRQQRPVRLATTRARKILSRRWRGISRCGAAAER